MSVAGFDCGDGSSITAGVELGHGGFGEVAAVGDLPFVVHIGQHGADEADDGGLVWSAARVETPSTSGSIATAYKAWSIRRRGSKITGKTSPYAASGSAAAHPRPGSPTTGTGTRSGP
jgi:hypothetical protein